MDLIPNCFTILSQDKECLLHSALGRIFALQKLGEQGYFCLELSLRLIHTLDVFFLTRHVESGIRGVLHGVSFRV